MKFLKTYSYDITKLLLNQLGLAVFGFVLTQATRLANQNDFGILSLFASLFAILFYLYLIYAMMQDLGARHKIRVESERLKRDVFLGAKIMLTAQIPNLLMLTGMFIGWAVGFAENGSPNGVAAYGVFQFILYFIQSMYDGLIGNLVRAFNPAKMYYLSVWAAYLVSILPGILVASFSYVMGLHDKKFLPTGYENKKRRDG